MAGDEVRVDSTDLQAKAIQIRELHLIKSMLGGVAPQPPDSLALSKTAVDNLGLNTRFLVENQMFGSLEGDRLAESLDSVAKAYDAVDAAARASIEGTGPPPEPVMPAGNELPAPTPPAPMGAPGAVSPDEIGDVEQTQEMLSAGDHGASLRSAAADWEENAAMLHAAAEKFQVRIQNWEGEAADQAYAKFVEFGQWLSDLGDAWHQLAGEAFRISDAHVKALLDHTPVYQRYVELKAAWMAAAAQSGGAAHNIAQQMEPLQRASESIIEGYAGEAAPHSVSPAKPPPSSGVPTAPVTSNGDPRRQTNPNGGGQSSGGGGGQSQPGGAPTSPAVSPMSSDPAASETPSGESPAGGGSPSGAGSPAGGGSPSGAGMPSLPGGGPSKDMPRLPDDPSLHPAAADAGGGAGGGSGGGSGGGAGPMPLQPSVGGVAVGPGPAGGVAPGGAAQGAAGPGGGTAGGMGGMPMGGHGQGQGGGKEKRRTPGLTPDEDIYTEERPWTEAIIGNRRRKDVKDTKDSQ